MGPASMPEPEPSPSPSQPICCACGDAVAKYRCPACDRRTCSVACVSAHKVEHGCTGKRPRAEYVAPLKAFTDGLLLRDYGLLEEVDFAVDRANRELQRGAEDLKLNHYARHRQRITLARTCAAPDRQIRLVLAPGAMAAARNNTSRVVEGGADGQRRFWPRFGKGKWKGKGKGKGKGKKGRDDGEGGPPIICWRVEWHFGQCGRVFVDKGMLETEVLGTALAKLLENDALKGRATKHLLLPYASAGLDGLEVFLEQPARARLAMSASAADACTTGPRHGEDSLSDEPEEEEEPQGGKGAGASAGGRALPPPPPPPPLAPAVPGEADGSEEEEEGADGGDASGGTSEVEEDAAGDAALPPPGAVVLGGATTYIRLDKSRPLVDNLFGRALVEHPVLHVALPEELSRFDPACAAPPA